MRVRSSWTWLLVVWFASLGSASVFAGQRDIPERARGAERVVVAKAVSVTPRWQRNGFGDELIVSEFVLEVEETLKGVVPAMVFLDLEGGTMGDVTLRVSGLPVVELGDRGVFFLEETPSGSHVPHRRGRGILKLDGNDQVLGSSLRLDDIRSLVRGAVR